jgi:hypothetical protein
MKISFCTVSMNRLHHVKETFIKNIEDNIPYNSEDLQVEFVLLNYNSADGLDEWAKVNLSSYMNAGVVSYYSTYEPWHFDRSHSRNLVFNLANGDIICNVDADNYLGKGFSTYLASIFSLKKDKIFLTPSFRQRDIMGKLCIEKDVYKQFRGYNEKMNGYGFEDLEFYARLVKHGVEQCFITEPAFLNAIKHSHAERYQNEALFKNFHSVYVKYVNLWTSSLLFLCKDYSAIIGDVISNEVIRSKYNISKTGKNSNEFSKFSEHDSIINLRNDWTYSTWAEDKHGPMILNFGEGDNYSPTLINDKSGYKKVLDNDLIVALLMLQTELSNRKIMNAVFDSSDLLINENGFGQGLVYKNNNSLTQITV